MTILIIGTVIVYFRDKQSKENLDESNVEVSDIPTTSDPSISNENSNDLIKKVIIDKVIITNELLDLDDRSSNIERFTIEWPNGSELVGAWNYGEFVNGETKEIKLKKPIEVQLKTPLILDRVTMNCFKNVNGNIESCYPGIAKITFNLGRAVKSRSFVNNDEISNIKINTLEEGEFPLMVKIN